MKSNREFRDLEDFTDSEEEVHPNIDSKSYRKFIKEQRVIRFEELKAKSNRTLKEQKEFEELEYKSLPVVKDVSENSFRTSKDDESTVEDYSDDLSILINCFTVKFFIDFLEKKSINLSVFEDLVDLNIVECIKCGNDEIGVLLCKIGLCTKWAKDFGKSCLLKLSENEAKLDSMVSDQYNESKKAILALPSE